MVLGKRYWWHVELIEIVNKIIIVATRQNFADDYFEISEQNMALDATYYFIVLLDLFQYYPSSYTWVFQVVSFPQFLLNSSPFQAISIYD